MGAVSQVGALGHSDAALGHHADVSPSTQIEHERPRLLLLLTVRARALWCVKESGCSVTCAPEQDQGAKQEVTPLLAQVCLLGRSRTYPSAAEAAVDQQRTQYISRRRPGCPAGLPAPPRTEAGSVGVDCCPHGPPDGPGALEAGAEGRWLPGFHPRDRAECVRNCTALPREFVDQVVLQVATLLLGGEQLSPGHPRRGSPQTWNRGGNALRAQPLALSDSDALLCVAGGLFV